MKILRCCALLSLSVLAGCRAQSALPPGAGASPGQLPPPVVAPPVIVSPQPEEASSASAPIVVTLAASQKSYRRGQLVMLTITARNAGTKSQTLRFSSGQIFDVTARKAGDKASNEIVWRWSGGKFFTQDTSALTLRPNRVQSWTATWNQSDNANVVVPRGDYILRATIMADAAATSPPLPMSLTN